MRPLSELYRLAGVKWCDLNAAADILEESKSSVLSQRKLALGDIPDNRRETIVRASAEWREYIDQMVEARRLANLAKIEMNELEMKFKEQLNADFARRAEMKL